jgi:transposase
LLLWEQYHAQHPGGYSYSQFCALFREFTATIDPRMRQTHPAGERLFVDYAGLTVPVVDRGTGEVHEAQVFVATLGASNYTFVEATMTQQLADWIGSHVRAFKFFGGVPRVLVPDNLKAGITSPHLYEPDINPTYMEMARHYGVAVVPARSSRPRDKAKVESHVLVVERQILARLRDRRYLSIQDLNEDIAPLLHKLNDNPFQKLDGTRRRMFEEIEAPALQPLPAEPYVLATWKKARVNLDYHIEVERSFYSVPFRFIKKQVEARMTARIVEVFHEGKRIASHCRSLRARQYVTCPDHMPPAHAAQAEWTPERLVRWARETGGSTEKAVETILLRHIHPQQGFRACLGILRLGKRHGQDRLEAACARILAAGYPSYKGIETILSKGLDRNPLAPSAPAAPVPDHPNIRGASYYAGEPAKNQCRTRSAVQTELPLSEE